MQIIRIEASDQKTENLIQFVTNGLDDSTLDEIEITREVKKHLELMSEPITIAVNIALGTAAIASVTRLIERWLENQRQKDTLSIIANAPSDEARKLLTALAEKHARVSVSYKLAKESWGKKE